MDPHLGLDAFWVSHTAMKPMTKVMQDFDAQFRLHQGHPPGSRAPLGYDSLMLYVEALRSTGWDPAPGKIADALRALRPYQGSSGLISFNGGQDPAKSVFIQHLTDKGDETFREIKP
jgi:ABC-type branched-subunit amino acid transport system substrate-binding protein